MIRWANQGDIPDIIEHGRKFHALGAFEDGYDGDHFGHVAEALLKDGGALVLRSDHGSAAMMNVPMLLTGEMSAQELWWYDPGGEGLGLLDAMEREATQAGAKHLVVSCMAKLKGAKVSRLLRMKGFEPMDHSHIKRIEAEDGR